MEAGAGALLAAQLLANEGHRQTSKAKSLGGLCARGRGRKGITQPSSSGRDTHQQQQLGSMADEEVVMSIEETNR